MGEKNTRENSRTQEMSLYMSAKSDFPSHTAITGAASMLVCRVETISAIAEVEAGPEGAFLDTGEPVILFEPHKFHNHTDGKFDGKRVPERILNECGLDITAKCGELSYPTWRPGWYGPKSFQHVRLFWAAKLNRNAALMSASWGLFQILGENYSLCGFDHIQRFVNAMYRSADDHLWALVRFIRLNSRLVDAIRGRDAKTFARIYNGPGYARNKYDAKLIAAGF